MLLGVMVGATAGFIVSSSRPVIFEATSKVLVQRGVSPGTPSLSDIQASQQLAISYGDLIKTRPILDRVVETLSLPYGTDALSGKFSVTSPRSLIEIKAFDQDPEMAMSLANAIAQSFIGKLRDQQFLQIAQFQSSLAQYGINEDPGIIAAQAATVSTLRMAEEAGLPSAPLSSRFGLYIGLGVVAGLVLAGFAVSLLEFLDDKVKSPAELQALTGLPVVGYIVRQRSKNHSGSVALNDSRVTTGLTESYNFLRSNLKFAALRTQDGLHALLVTSATPMEGKTTTAANLAISEARQGKAVILVDSDLRKPALHRIFDISQQKGLTSVILGDIQLEEALVPTDVEGLRLVPSGPLPPDATHVLESSRMNDVVDQMKRSADLVIFDSPPLLVVIDPMLIVSYVEGVVLVVNSEKTRQEAVRLAVQNLQRTSSVFVVSVLNMANTKGSNTAYYYYDTAHYYSVDGTEGSRHQASDSGGRFKFFKRLARRREDATKT